MATAAGLPATAPDRQSPRSSFATPTNGWWHVFKQAWLKAGEDNIGLAAAGVGFYGFLAIVPLLGAIVLSYGLIAEPATVLKDMQHLTAVMPGDTAKLVGEQLMNVVKTSGTRKGFGLLIALALALFGARSGAGSVITGLNIAYERKELRSFVKINLLAIGITIAAVLVAIVALIAIAALGHLEKLIPGTPEVVLVISKIITYVLVVLSGAAGAATLYRYAPNHVDARWVWLTPGSTLAAFLWLLLTMGFGVYVAELGNYNATYGSLGAVAVTMTWLYLSAYVLLLGAELNAELEQEEAPRSSGNPNLAGEPETLKPTPERAPAVATPPVLQTPGILTGVAFWRAGRRARRTIGRDEVALAPSLLAAGGLALLNRRDHAASGFALLAVGGLVALLSTSPGPGQADNA